MLFINLLIQTISLISNYTTNKDYVNYLDIYNKSYSLENYNIFMENKNYIDQFNSNTHSFELDINHLVDEKLIFMSNFKPKKNCHNCIIYQENNDIPESIDWRSKNKVAHVKDQGQCGGKPGRPSSKNTPGDAAPEKQSERAKGTRRETERDR